MTAAPAEPLDPEVELLVADLADEFLARSARGESPDPVEYAARHPEAADLIVRVLGIMGLAPAPARWSAPASVHAGPVPDVLGDFRIRREVGRGGMGVVYEAEQLGLGRRVALKVLPFSALSDARLVQRFRNEARAAAALDHPHVVKVHAVGEAGGTHFLAMQFIDGRPLSDLIRERQAAAVGRPASPNAATATLAAGDSVAETDTVPRAATTPTRGDAAYFKQVAAWGVQAAEALEHAHSLGIVHRDVKPGNLLLDSTGNVWVADFGLAKLAASDAGLTGTGDVLGTLRYIAPEQALSKHDLVDGRADVYALGATLYELLTGAPAVDGRDRVEILRKIAAEEPIPPGKLDRGIPTDLETVVLKCLAKEPADRYPSAGELAADLNRFLGHLPVRAWRPTVRQRAAKWARRHPWAAATLLGGLIAAVAGAGVWERRRAADRRETAAAAGAARRVADEAEGLWRQGRQPEALAVAERGVGLLPPGADGETRGRVEGMAADLRLVCRLEEARLAQLAPRADVGWRFDDGAAVPLYREAFRDYGLDVLGADEAAVAAALRGSAVRAEAAAALEDWAEAALAADEKDRLGRLAAAVGDDMAGLVARARRAAAAGDAGELGRIAEEAEADPPPPAIVARLAAALDRPAAPLAVRVLRAGQHRHPGDLWVNLLLAQRLAWGGRPAEAVEYGRAALAVRPGSAPLWGNLASTLAQATRFTEAEAAARRAVAIDPDDGLANYHLAHALAAVRRFAEAEPAARRAASLLGEDWKALYLLGHVLTQVGRLPESVDALSRSVVLNPEYAPARHRLAIALSRQGRLPEAEAAGRRAVALDPHHAQSHFDLGVILHRRGNLPESEAAFRRSGELKPTDANAFANLGLTLMDQHKAGEAEAAYRRAIEIDPALLHAHFNLGVLLNNSGRVTEGEAAHRRAIAARPDFAPAHFNLGLSLCRQDRLPEAEVAFRRAAELNPGGFEGHFFLGRVLADLRRGPEAEAAFRRALDLDPRHAEAHCRLGHLLQQRGAYPEAATAFRTGHDLGVRRPDWRLPSADWVRTAERLAALDARLGEVLAGKGGQADAAERRRLAEFCLRSKPLPFPLGPVFAAALLAEGRPFEGSGPRPGEGVRRK